MPGQTIRIPHPLGDKPLRANILVTLLDLDSAHLFVGDLIARPDLPYMASMIEGGIDQGERPEEAIVRELKEEAGITDAKHLATLDTPVSYRFGDSDTAKYFGKTHIVAVYAIADRSQIDLNAGHDEEGPTFRAHRFLPIKDAENYLLERTSCEIRQSFIREIIRLIRPIEQALREIGPSSLDEIDAQRICASLPQDADRTFRPTAPADFPTPSRNDPSLARRPQAVGLGTG